MTTYIVLARTEGEGLAAARALSLRPAIYPMTAEHLAQMDNQTPGWTLLRVEGWEHSPQPIAVAEQATRVAREEVAIPTAWHLRFGAEAAMLAQDTLAARRVAPSPFLDGLSADVAAVEHELRSIRRAFAHIARLCPTARAGLPCRYYPTSCRWPS